MNVRFVLAGVAFLALIGCASTSSQPIAATTPVKVVITTAPSIDKVINAAKTTAQTELWLRKLAPDAPAATVTMRFTGTMLVSASQMASTAAVHGNPEAVTYRSMVASFSQTPWLDGFQPVIAVRTAPSGTITTEHEVVVRGTYTITDANGVTLEEGPLLTEPGDNQRGLAWFVADRLKALTRKSG